MVVTLNPDWQNEQDRIFLIAIGPYLLQQKKLQLMDSSSQAHVAQHILHSDSTATIKL